MAYREVRIYFVTGDIDEEIRLSRELWEPFTEYMDNVMRGRFRSYSGNETKGVNIVNLILHKNKNDYDELSQIRKGGWIVLLNTYEYNIHFDYSKLIGSREEKLYILIEVFIEMASKSKLKQMEILCSHIRSSYGVVNMTKVIKSADMLTNR